MFRKKYCKYIYLKINRIEDFIKSGTREVVENTGCVCVRFRKERSVLDLKAMGHSDMALNTDSSKPEIQTARRMSQ